MTHTEITARIYATADHFNPRLQATVPGSWTITFDDVPQPLRDMGCNVIPEFYGTSRRNVIENCVQNMRDLGLTGNLRLHA